MALKTFAFVLSTFFPKYINLGLPGLMTSGRMARRLELNRNLMIYRLKHHGHEEKHVSMSLN